MGTSVWGRLGGISGILFAVLFILGAILPELPGGGQSESTVNEFYADSGNRMLVIVAAYLFAIAGIAFLAFISSLYRGLRQAEGESGSLSTITLVGGIVFVAMLYVMSSAWGTVPAGMELAGESQPGNEIPVWFAQLGYGSLLLHGMFAAIAMIVSASIVVLRTAILPRWLAWAGFVCAAILLLGVAFIPMIALPIWAIATSVAMLRSPAIRAARVSSAQPQAA